MPDWTAVFHPNSYLPAAWANAPQTLSAQGGSELRAIVESANLPDLRWPNWSDYRMHVEKFYDSSSYIPARIAKGI